MANQTIRNYTQSLTEDANRDANTVFYGANSSGDRKLTASKFMTLWSDTRTYLEGEVCFTSIGNTFRSLQNANINYDPEDVGNSTFWENIGGGGSGSVIGNIFPDPTGSKGNEGWTETSATVSTVSVGDIGFDTELNIVTTGAGNAVLNIPVPIQLRGEDMELNFEFFVTSGTPLIKFYREDGTTEVPTSNLALPTSGKAKCLARLFMTNEATINLKISGTNIDCAMTNVYFGRHENVYGAAIGQSTTYTPTLTNAGTSPSITKSSYIQTTEFFEGSIKLVLGTALPASELRVGLPSDLLSSSDYATIEVCGQVARSTSIAEPVHALIEPSKGYITFGRQYLSAGGLTKLNANNFSASEVLSITFKVKMAQLVGANVVNLAQSAGPMYLSNTAFTADANATSSGSFYGIEGALLNTTTLTAQRKVSITLPRTLQPNEVSILELRSKKNGIWVPIRDTGIDTAHSGFAHVASSNVYGAYILDDTVGEIQVSFEIYYGFNNTGNSVSWGTLISDANGFDRWRVRIGPQNVVELPPPIIFQATKTATQALTADVTDITFASILRDTAVRGNVNGSYTIPTDGNYEIKFKNFATSTSNGSIFPFLGGTKQTSYPVLYCDSTRVQSDSIVLACTVGQVLTFRLSATLTIAPTNGIIEIRKL